MIKTYPGIMMLLILCVWPVVGFAQVRLDADERILQLLDTPEPVPVPVLIEASLVASGTPVEKIKPYSKKIQAMISQIPVRSGDDATDAREILAWMHKNILTQYVETQTRMDTLLIDGKYNCVSSAVLYVIFVRSLDLNIHGVLTKDHVFVQLPDIIENGNGVDVETTIAFGYNPGQKNEAMDAFTGRTGFVYVPPGNYRKRTNINEMELIGLIYQNRISMLQNQGRWEDTVGLSLDRWKLTGTQQAEEDFIASLKNVAAEADRTGQILPTLKFFIQARAKLDNWQELEQTAIAIFSNAITRHLRAREFDQARQLVNNPDVATIIPASFIDEKRVDIEISMLNNAVQTQSFEAANLAVQNAYQSGAIKYKKWSESMLYIWSLEAKKRSKNRNWLAGWQFLAGAPDDLKSDTRWKKMEQIYQTNVVIAFHNSFVKLYNSGRYNEASAILDEGLALFPGNKKLLNNRNLLKQTARDR